MSDHLESDFMCLIVVEAFFPGRFLNQDDRAVNFALAILRALF